MNLKLLFVIAIISFNYKTAFPQLKVSCIGASVAAGYGIPIDESYPSQIQDILGNNFNVGNFGVSGATMLKEADDPYINSANYSGAQAFNPNIVTIELGSNDSKPYNWVYKDSFVADYTRFINVFKALPSHPVIYICMPIPALTTNYSLNDSNITYGIIPLVKQISVDNNVNLIDLNTALIGRTDLYQADGIHPNAAGALVLAQIIAKAIASPSNLTANVVSVNQIDLYWTDNTNETSFSVERSTDSITWNPLATVSANATSYSDVGLVASTKYYYRVYATISIGNTAYSNIVSTVTTLANSMIPEITNADTSSVTMGTVFNYTITATNNPSSYSAINLPAGLTINSSTGVISGITTIAASTGVADVITTVYATNANGTGSATLTISVIPVAVPYNGSPALIPGKIEAENYDYGGEGIAYHDTDPANTLGQYRTSEGVDIENCADTGGGYSIGQIQAGEWVQYSVNIVSTGIYTLQLRVASINSGEHFNVLLNGTDISGTLTVPNTGGWQTWQTVSVVIPMLTTGQKKLRIEMGTGGFNINNMNFIFTGVPLPVKLISFNAVMQGCNNIILKWQTSEEINTAYYEIESSTDDNSFSMVGTVFSNQGNTSMYNYTYNTTIGDNYFFRLKMVDKNGTFNYSPVIGVANNNCIEKGIITISPNPVISILKVNNLDGKANFITIYNMAGKEVENLQATNNTVLLDMNDLPSGNYVIKIMNEKGELLKSSLIIH